MDIGDESVTDPAAEFGELFEGQTSAFENDLEDHDPSDVLGTLDHDMGLGSSTHHPTEHEILAANLQFVPDDYLQQQHIVLGNENADYGVPVTEMSDLESQTQNHRSLQENSQQLQQVYVQHPNLSHSTTTTTATSGTNPYFNEVSNQEMHQDNQNQMQSDTVKEEPKVKQKVKVVKSVEHFTNAHIERYLKRRGFKTKQGSTVATKKTIPKTVLALLAEADISRSNFKVISFRSNYEPEHVIQEMERFWQFYLTTKRTPSVHTNMSKELSPMLIPMLLHFFFEMMFDNLFPIARRICAEFSKKFFLEDKTQEQYNILVAILKVTSVEMLKSDKMLGKIIDKKYEFVLSEPTIAHIRRFLSKSSQPILVNLFTNHFVIRSRESKELFEGFDWESMLDSEVESASSESEEDDDKQNIEDIDDSDFNVPERNSYALEIIDDLRNSVSANLPAISVYTCGSKPVCGAVSKKGSLIAYGLAEAGIQICCVERARDVSKLATYDSSDFESFGVKSVGGHAGTVYGVHFHPRTKLLFSVGQDSLMRAWDLNADNPRCRAIYRGHVGPVWNIDIPDSGSLIATAGFDTTARIFLPERNEFVRMMAGHYFGVNTVKFHPNEAYIATGSTDKSVRLWSVNDGNIVRMFTGPAANINCIAFHESGKYLAGGGEDNKIIIWDLAEGEIVYALDTLANCNDLVFSGNMLSACFRNGMVQIFNLRPIIGGGANVTSSSISAPFTSKCYADSLFKVYYKNPGSLFCLGSDLTKKENYEFPPQKTSNTDECDQINNNSTNAVNLEEPNSNASLSRNVIQTRTSVVNSDVEDSSQDSSAVGSACRILATRLSQPLSVSSTSGDEAIKEVSRTVQDNSSSVGMPPARTTSIISSSDLDAAIASVIDQSGGGDLTDTGGGTITMYASS